MDSEQLIQIPGKEILTKLFIEKDLYYLVEKTDVVKTFAGKAMRPANIITHIDYTLMTYVKHLESFSSANADFLIWFHRKNLRDVLLADHKEILEKIEEDEEEHC